MNTNDVCKLATFISQRCALCCWSAVFQSFRRRHRLPPVHRLPPEGNLWRKQRLDFSCDLLPLSTGKMFDCSSDTSDSSLNPVQCDILPHCYSQLSDLTIRLYSMTSLKCISLKRWLYHHMFKLFSDQFSSQDANHVISHSSFWLVSSLTADIYCYYDYKYVNIHRHQLFIFSKSTMDNRWQRLSNAKLAHY